MKKKILYTLFVLSIFQYAANAQSSLSAESAASEKEVKQVIQNMFRAMQQADRPDVGAGCNVAPWEYLHHLLLPLVHNRSGASLCSVLGHPRPGRWCPPRRAWPRRARRCDV
jgi:hypothetical protein